MSAFSDMLEQKGPLVADGATGTNLALMGLEPGGHSEEWVFDHPERIVDLERAFVAAGSDIILTTTFGATSVRMQGTKYEQQSEELNRAAANLARSAALNGNKVLVAGSMGPLGKLLKPLGPLTREEALGAYATQARGLSAGGVDLLIVETQFSLDEAEAAFEAIRGVSSLPIVVSFSYDRGTRTMMGLRPSAAAAAMGNLGAAMIGVNCGTTLENALQIVSEYASSSPGLPIWAKPNAGLPHIQDDQTTYDVNPKQMGEFALRAIERGATVVGGCCGTTPEHIQAVVEAIGRREQAAR